MVQSDEERQSAKLPFRNIVVGADFTPAMAANVEEAMRLAGGTADRLTLLHVVNECRGRVDRAQRGTLGRTRIQPPRDR